MNMYSLVIGTSGWPMGVLDAIFGIEPEMCPRYRDHWMEREGDSDDALVLAVYTRTGGDNREAYQAENTALQMLPTYWRDEDDSYDPTYATFRFRMTKQEFLERMQVVDAMGKVELAEGATFNDTWAEMYREAEPVPRDMSVIWAAMIAAIPGARDEKV